MNRDVIAKSSRENLIKALNDNEIVINPNLSDDELRDIILFEMITVEDEETYEADSF